MVIPILIQFSSFVLNWSVAGRKMQHVTRRYVTLLKGQTIIESISKDILSQFFVVIHSDAAVENQVHCSHIYICSILICE